MIIYSIAIIIVYYSTHYITLNIFMHAHIFITFQQLLHLT
jgi:hypothetical protein